MRTRIPTLDGLRFVAIFLVVCSHGSASSGWPRDWNSILYYLPDAQWGVRLFFIISGFIITQLLLREEKQGAEISLQNFYARRTLRILPVYFAYLFVVAIVSVSVKTDINPGDYLRALTFTVGDWGEQGWTLGHLWSLSVEEQFYLLWPPLLTLLPRARRLPFMLIFFAALPFVRWLCAHLLAHHIAGFPIMVNADFLTLGCIVALAQGTVFFGQLLKWVDARLAWIRGALILSVWFGCVLLESNGGTHLLSLQVVHTLSYVHRIMLAALFISLVYIRRGAAYRVLNFPVISKIGVLSYSIYIWQQIFLGPQFGASVWWRTFPLNVLLLLSVSIISYYLVETPFLRLKNRVAKFQG